MDGLRIKQGGKGLIVQFRYNAAAVAAIKTVPGATFSGGDRTWTISSRGVPAFAAVIPAIRAALNAEAEA